MFFVFTYYNNEVDQFFVKALRSLASTIQTTKSVTLIIISEVSIFNKVLKSIDSLFSDIIVVQPKLFLTERNRLSNVVNPNFLETLISYTEHDRIYFDPSLFMVNLLPVPINESVFFKQKTGLLSTKLAILKAGNQFNTAFAAFKKSQSISTMTDREFTYVVSNNFLIEKRVSNMTIMDGILFSNSNLSVVPESVISMDLVDFKNQSSTKLQTIIESISAKQKLQIFTKIKKEGLSLPFINRSNAMVFKKIEEDRSRLQKRRLTLEKIISEVDVEPDDIIGLSEFTDRSKLTVLIPVYKNADVLAICLESILLSTDDSFNLLVINDSPFDTEVDELCKKFIIIFKKARPNSEYVFLTNQQNLGFIKTVNFGFKMVTGDVILLNSDTQVSPGWADRFLQYKNYAKVASVTPLSNSATHCSFPIQEIDQRHYREFSPSLIDAVFSRVPMAASHEAPTGVGFCMLMTKEALSEIGTFDEVNFTLGYGEENDWCWRAKLAGFVNIIAPNVYIGHEHGLSFANVQNLSTVRLKNKNALIAKYPNYFSVIFDYYNQKSMVNLYPLLKYALDFEYTRSTKKPVRLILGEFDVWQISKSDYSNVCLRITDSEITVKCNDFLISKATVFMMEKETLHTLIALLNPTIIEVLDSTYLKSAIVKTALSNFSHLINPAKSVIVEIPNVGFQPSGGTARMQKLVIELPRYSSTSGGVLESLKLMDKFPSRYTVSARFQRLSQPVPPNIDEWTVGLPDSTFPQCDACITYSDNPYLSDLVKLPQVGTILLYMLSYGMAIDRERKNVQMDGVTVMCSSKKLERAISADCGTVHRVGFALDMHDMHPEAGIVRRNYLAIMYHPNPDKGYSTAVAVADVLYAKKKIDGVITFGTTIGYNDATKPMALIKHYQNANRDQIREIFNTCKCFLMPSISEGLNLTPIESTLCGCPTVLCDGAIDEIFFNNKNCLVVDKNNVGQMEAMVLTVLDSFESHSSKFMKRMRFVIKSYTWNTVIENILKLL